ncbi:hypothetical protein ACFWCB_26270 [Streptomyces sp. NPDC060048]|uniref:hypothetical protein n=1 Tax=unclassified Streptomyces TaxID=2593676 RepID=UPI003696A404
MPVTLDVAQRRTLVAQMSRGGVSIRAMATLLGVTKDVIHRDRKALAEAATATPATRAEQARQRVADITATLHDLRDTVDALVSAQPAYQLALDDATAAVWHATIRDTAAELTALTATFGDYYPALVALTATPPAPAGDHVAEARAL